jgi:hypothetical protein
MKNLLGKEIKRGDEVIGIVGDSLHAGRVNQLYETTDPKRPKDVVRISGFDLVIPASDIVHASDAWEAIKPALQHAKGIGPSPVITSNSRESQL